MRAAARRARPAQTSITTDDRGAFCARPAGWIAFGRNKCHLAVSRRRGSSKTPASDVFHVRAWEYYFSHTTTFVVAPIVIFKRWFNNELAVRQRASDTTEPLGALCDTGR